jgi:hypothetical protein
MQTVAGRLENTIQEYQDLLGLPKGIEPCTAELEWLSIRSKLQTDARWTEDGAEQVATLARNYGSFVLRNALALAITLGIEDGELGL